MTYESLNRSRYNNGIPNWNAELQRVNKDTNKCQIEYIFIFKIIDMSGDDWTTYRS